MVFPYRVKNPPDSPPWVTYSLIGLNTIIFFLTSPGLEVNEEILKSWGLTASNASPATFLSSMFLHADLFHLAGNMWFLYLFGVAVEGRLKWYRFLPLYLLSGVAGDLCQWAFSGGASREIPSLGASGAIMGILGAGLWLFPFAKVQVFYWLGWLWWGVWDAPLWLVGLYYFGIEVVMGLLSSAADVGAGVAHWAHVGGAAVGFLGVILLAVKRDTPETSMAKDAYAETGDLSMLAPWELRDLAMARPDDSHTALMWMWRSLGRRQVTDECVHHFLSLLPSIAPQEDAASVSGVLANLCSSPVKLPSEPILRAAVTLETKGFFPDLANVYASIRAWPQTTDEDRETATFRLARMKQQHLGQVGEASRLYNEVLQRWPMGAFAEAARQALDQAGAP